MIHPLFLALALPLLAIVSLCLFWPLRGSKVEADRRQYDLAVYRDQLSEIERDQAQGLIPESQAEAARVEIRRRILRATGAGSVAPEGRSAGSARSLPGSAVAGLALGLPALAFMAYLSLGRPDLPSVPFANRTAPIAARSLPELQAQATALEAKLAQAPNDSDGWLRLGRLQGELGQIDRALRSMRRAHEEAPGDGRIQVELADLLTRSAGGVVTPEAKDLFGKSLAAAGGEDFADPRTVYFLGVAEAQGGDVPGAIARWRRLLARAPADAPWRSELAESIKVASTQAGIAPEAAEPVAGPAGPNAADVQAMAALSPAERAARIGGMVDGLEARLQDTPDDVDGWLRLARARTVLGQQDKAAAAYAKAAGLRPNDPAILAAWGNALVTKTHAPTGMPLVDDQAKAVFERLEKVAPADPQPAWFLGLAAIQHGDRKMALAYWRKLLELLPMDNPDRQSIQDLVDELGQ